jgi:hypothetical protein
LFVYSSGACREIPSKRGAVRQFGTGGPVIFAFISFLGTKQYDYSSFL